MCLNKNYFKHIYIYSGFLVIFIKCSHFYSLLEPVKQTDTYWIKIFFPKESILIVTKKKSIDT